MSLRTILRHINLLNILLLGIIAAVVSYALSFYLDININIAMPQPRAFLTQETKTEPAQANPISEYSLIAEHNLFHPERRIPPEKKTEQQLPKPDFVLYGTLITDETKIAYLEDLKAPHTTAGRGKRQRALQLGQNLSGYAVKEIYPNKVVMLRGDEVIEVRIGDNKKKRPSIDSASPAPTAQPAIESPVSEKPKGAPPGVVHSGPPPAGVSMPDEKTTSRVKEAIEAGIMKRPGFQRQTEKNR